MYRSIIFSESLVPLICVNFSQHHIDIAKTQGTLSYEQPRYRKQVEYIKHDDSIAVSDTFMSIIHVELDSIKIATHNGHARWMFTTKQYWEALRLNGTLLVENRFNDSQWKMIHEYFNGDGSPKKCLKCGADGFIHMVRDTIDSTMAEAEVICANCSTVCGYYSHGSYDPDFALELIHVMKKLGMAQQDWRPSHTTPEDGYT